MSPDRWQQIKTIFEAALECEPDARARFLDERCGPDADLRREIDSLIAADAELAARPGFLDDVSPHLVKAGAIPPHDDEDTVTSGGNGEDAGMRVGPWQLVREIGRGGMGVVYLAVRADSEFRKRVAIKLIRHGMENEFAIRRFRNERQILATMEHPNIARLIDGGTTERGVPYFVMEYVEGEPLLRYSEAHALSTDDRLEIFKKVCSAVHYAHRRLIVHRDLKPGNVLVKKDGTPKLLDFGIAKILDPDTTDGDHDTTVVGVRLVTPAYASPEQMRGEPATVRSDIYSLGVILCELVAGCKPNALPPLSSFSGTSAHTGTATAPAEALSPDLRTVIRRAVRTSPDDRYESVEELIADIDRVLTGAPVPYFGSAVTVPALEAPPAGSIAVLPLRLLDRDTSSDAYLATGITDAIITRMSAIGRIAVRPTSAVLRYVNTDNAVAAGRELNVEFVLEGSVRRVESRVRVTVQLVPVRSGSPVWAASFDEDYNDLLTLEDSISGQVAQALVPQLSGEERQLLKKRGTRSAKAHEAYLRGRWHWNTHTEDGLAKALIYFNQAIAEDPAYARAHAGVADYYIQLGLWGGLPPSESFAAAKQAASKALSIDGELAEAHTSYGVALWACDRDHSEAAHHLQLAITLNPEYPTAHQWFGMLMSARGRSEMAIACLERARRLDPRSPALATSLARALINARQYDRAIRDLTDGTRAPDEHYSIPEMLAWAYALSQRTDEALVSARRAVRLARNPLTMSVLAYAEAAAGNTAAARTLLEELERSAQERYVSAYSRASLRLSAGDRAGAVEWLQKAWDDGDWWALWTTVDPRWDSLRGDASFARIAGVKPRTDPQPKPASRPWSRRTYVALLVVIAAIVAYFAPGQFRRQPFTNVRMSKLTTNGTATQAAISPDGSLVAYVAPDLGKPAIWLRAEGRAVPVRLTPAYNGQVTGIQFTADGRYLTFIGYTRNEPTRGILYRVPVSGGPALKLLDDVPVNSAVSGDGGRIALLRSNPQNAADELRVAALNGGSEHTIATRRYPNRFSWASSPAWSSDGGRIALPVEGSDKQGFFVHLAVVAAGSGSTQVLSNPRWQYVERVVWTSDGSGLFVIGQEHESSFQQIWYVPYPKGRPKRISNDLNDYIGVSLSADTKSLVSVQIQTLSNVWVASRGSPSQARQITPGSGRYFDLSWTPDGKIVYASDASGTADIWAMNADGSGQRLLTSGLGRNYAPSVSPDGKTIAFHSNRSGNWNVWTMDADGANQQSLAKDTHDSNWPQFSPDGRFIIYHHTEPNAMWNIFKAPISGGPPVRLTTALTTHPAVDRRTGRIACWYSADAAKPSWKLAVFAPDGGEPLRLFDTAPTVPPDTTVRWTPDGEGITYVDARRGVSNLWVQPVDGSPPRAITNFSSGQIFSFDWSQDGQLAYSRGMSTSDVVLIRDSAERN